MSSRGERLQDPGLVQYGVWGPKLLESCSNLLYDTNRLSNCLSKPYKIYKKGSKKVIIFYEKREICKTIYEEILIKFLNL